MLVRRRSQRPSLEHSESALDIPGIEKLIEVTANGIGSVVGRMFTSWKARKAGEARVIAAEADARVLQIRAQAHKEARELLLADEIQAGPTEIDIGETIIERVRYQEKRRPIEHRSGSQPRRRGPRGQAR